MMFSSWDMKRNRQNFLSFLTVFCPFTPLTSWKIKILKNWNKKPGDIIILHMCTINDNYICLVPLISSTMDRFFVILDNFLPFYSPNNPKNQNFEKLTKMPSDIIIFQMCTINDNHVMFCSWDMQRDGQNFLSFWTIFCPFIPLKTWKINI